MKNDYLIANNGSLHVLSMPKRYKIDFDKVKTIEDLVPILRIIFNGLPITFSEESIKHIRDYVVEVDN